MKTCPTFRATIYVGSLNLVDRTCVDVAEIDAAIQDYVNDVKLCVTVDYTTFRYVDGYEGGWVVGLINYPRYPSTPEKIRELALGLARILKKVARQARLSVVFPDETVMLEENE